MVTAGTQLASQGLLENSALETLGHWEKGSKMPVVYNSAACVTELQTRSVIAEALRSGWRPASDGNLPAPATPMMERSTMPRTPTATVAVPKAAAKTSEEAPQEVKAEATQADAPKIVVVVNTQRKMAHRVRLPSERTLCIWFTCGSPARPAHNAEFTAVGSNKRCFKCFNSN